MSIRIRVIFSVAAIVSAQLALAGVKPVYSLVSPGATPLYMPVRSEAVEPVHAAWAVTNAFVAPSAGFYNYGATQETNKSDRTTNLSAPVRRFNAVTAGFPAERNKPLYYLGDKLLAPEGVDWDETYRIYDAAEGIRDNFLFDTINKAVYVVRGETSQFTWVVAGADGALTTNSYVIVASPVSGERPKKYSGCVTMYWSSAEDEATRMVSAVFLRRPARPASCQVLAIEPG